MRFRAIIPENDPPNAFIILCVMRPVRIYEGAPTVHLLSVCFFLRKLVPTSKGTKIKKYKNHQPFLKASHYIDESALENVKMEKQKADVIITEYLQKIYGFAFKKSFSYDEAEELAAEMTAEVYRALRCREEICNIEGYIWRICEHTYAKYVSSSKKREGVSIDETEDIPYFSAFDDDDDKISLLRREIAFLSSARREIIFRFYYKNEPVKTIASRLNIPEGTVKWHLNKARNELKEGLKMERKIGSLGINPVKALSFGHSGVVGKNDGPEYYLGDKLSLNIVYSVYFEPKNTLEIAEELGVTPVFIEDKVALLENNGYLVKTKGGRYTTYVVFTPRVYSKEQDDNILKKTFEAVGVLIKEYVPLVRKAVSDAECYIPGGSRQLLEAAAVFYGVTHNCRLKSRNPEFDLRKYYISDLDGGKYIAFAELESECSDPDYEMTFKYGYNACGSMWRTSEKYPAAESWAIDSRFDSREGGWKNNLTSDYEYMYEFLTGKLGDAVVNADKLNRLKKRRFIGENGEVQIMVCKGSCKDFFNRIPKLDDGIKESFGRLALEKATQEAKLYPPQIQDLIFEWNGEFIDRTTAMMVLDVLYSDGTFKPLTDKERITANLIMFSDVLPEK